MKRSIAALLFIASLGTSACNTVEGLGHDVRNAGEWTSDTAQKTKDKINNR